MKFIQDLLITLGCIAVIEDSDSVTEDVVAMRKLEEFSDYLDKKDAELSEDDRKKLFESAKAILIETIDRLLTTTDGVIKTEEAV